MHKLKRIGIWSLAKTMGLFYALLALIVIIPATMFLTVATVQPGGGPGLEFLWILALPIMYGAGGFVGGLIIAVIANMVLGFSGGLALEIQAPRMKRSYKPVH